MNIFLPNFRWGILPFLISLYKVSLAIVLGLRVRHSAGLIHSILSVTIPPITVGVYVSFVVLRSENPVLQVGL